MKLLNTYPFLFLFLLFHSCKKEQQNSNTEPKSIALIKYAKGFEIETFERYSKLTISTPYPNSEEVFEYVLATNKTDKSQFSSDAKIIDIPLKSIVVNSTTHIPMLELLDSEELLIGFPNTDYVSSEKTRKRIDENKIQDLGNDGSFNTEILLDLNPDVVVAFSMSAKNKSLQTIERAGITVINNGDWLEETPLGRAEWIKLFGVLFDKNKEAQIIFDQIKTDYQEAVEIAQKAATTPTVLSGVMFKDVWNLPAGESFVAQFLKDANTNYLWQNTKGKGSLQLSFEAVLEKGKNAEYWIAPGHYEAKEQLLNASTHYLEFDAFKSDNVFTFATKKGRSGGVIYYELAPIRPDLVLKDIIKFTHPELLPEYQMTFFEKMN